MRQATVRSIPQCPHLRFQPCRKRESDEPLCPGSGASISQRPWHQRTRSPTTQRHLCFPCGTAQHPSGGQRVKFHDHRLSPTRPIIQWFIARICPELEPDRFPCPSVQRHQHINPTTLIPLCPGIEQLVKPTYPPSDMSAAAFPPGIRFQDEHGARGRRTGQDFV